MHGRRLACLLLGLWLGGTLFMGVVATQNFRSIDSLMEEADQPIQDMIQRLGGDAPVRNLLRHHAAEQNRFYFAFWELSQLALGILLFGLLLFGTHEGKLALAIPLAMVLLVAVLHWFVTPSIVGLARELYVTPPGGQTYVRQQMVARHFLYSILELAKLALAGLLGAVLIWSRSSRRILRPEEAEVVPMPVRLGR